MMHPAEIDAMMATMQTTMDHLTKAPPGPSNTITLKEAAYVAGVTEAQMRKRCEKNLYGTKPGGFGWRVRKGCRWEVVVAPFVNSLPVKALPRLLEVIRAPMRD
jgi:hypothetical protein